MSEDRPYLGQYQLYDDLYHKLTERSTVTTRCDHCEWVETGPFEETRKAFTAHRKSAHPFVRPSMPNPRAKSVTPQMRQAA